MSYSSEAISRHYGQAGLIERIVDGLQLAKKDLAGLGVDDLAPIDEFHTRGRDSTVELAGLVDIESGDQVLDIGCGLGGTARYLADRFMCRVTGLDLTEEYVQVGNRLSELVGLSERVELRHGNALDLPFVAESFAFVWTEHAQMNIADKELFYSEAARVLSPGGQFLFHDVILGESKDVRYPLPWAEDRSISALANESKIRSSLEGTGFRVCDWFDKREESIEFFERVLVRLSEQGAPPFGIHLLMGGECENKD